MCGSTVGLRDEVTVLYVDDEPELSSLVATYLEREAADVELVVETTERPRDALSIVESIVEAHGWAIRAASETGGARFEIRTTARTPEFEAPVGRARTD